MKIVKTHIEKRVCHDGRIEVGGYHLDDGGKLYSFNYISNVGDEAPEVIEARRAAEMEAQSVRIVVKEPVTISVSEADLDVIKRAVLLVDASKSLEAMAVINRLEGK